MSLGLYIGIVVVLFLLGAGAFYLFSALKGPARLEDLESQFKKGQYKFIIPELQKIVEDDETNKRARFLLARSYQSMGNYGPAILEFRQLTKGKFTFEAPEVEVRKGLAECFYKSEKISEARDEYLLLSQIDARNYEPYYRLGEIFFQSNNLTKAIGFLKKAIQLNPRHAESFNLLGQCQYQMQSYQDAKTALINAVQLKPALSVASYFLGLTLRYLGDVEWALKELEKAEKDEEIRVKAIMARGMVLIDAENYPRAIMELDRGLKFAIPGSEPSINIRYLLSMAAEKNRDVGTAIEHWEKIESLRPGFRDVRQKLKEFAEFRVDDSIKDFMIANNEQFENLSRKVIEGLGYTVSSINIKNDTTLVATALEPDAGKRMRRQNTYILILRDMEPLSDKIVRDVQEQMKSNNAPRGLIITAGEISATASEFASSRPIEIYDTSRIVQALKSVS